MKLDSAITRDDLRLLVEKHLRQRLLASSFLNLPRVALYALYFVFMPAAILGALPGVLGTAVLAAVAAYKWLWGEPQSFQTFMWFWLIWAVVDWVLLVLFRTVVGLWEYRVFRSWLPEEDLPGTPDLRPGGVLKLEFGAGEEREVPLVVEVPEQAVYVLALKVEQEDASVELGLEDTACMVEYEHVPGLVQSCRAAYRLSAGRHALSFRVQSCTDSCLVVSLR